MPVKTKGRMCDGKRRYATKAGAAQAIRSLIASGRAYPGQMTTYQCGHCNGHHVGHRGRKRR